MVARPWLVVVVLGALASLGAQHRTRNFVVEAPTEKLAERMGQWAEYYRKEKALQWLDENWIIETLREDGTTSYDNESSVVLYAYLNNDGILLTGDAGIQALTRAASYLERYDINLPQVLKFVQVPHHGSRHNVGPTILSRLLGPKLAFGAAATKTAFVSAGATSQTHPRRVVTNAFKRRGAPVYAAKGRNIWHYRNVPSRPTWTAAPEVPFYDKVEG